MKKALIYLGLVLSLTVVGFLTWNFFLHMSFSQINKQNLDMFVNIGMVRSFKSNLIFAIVIGILPMIYVAINKLTRLKLLHQKLITIGIILSSGIIFWQLRIFQISKKMQQLSNLNLGEGIEHGGNFYYFNFEIYLFIGFLTGRLISILIFKRKNKAYNKL